MMGNIQLSDGVFMVSIIVSMLYFDEIVSTVYESIRPTRDSIYN